MPRYHFIHYARCDTRFFYRERVSYLMMDVPYPYTKATAPTDQMLVKVGYVRDVGADCPATKAMLQQPATETLQKIP